VLCKQKIRFSIELTDVTRPASNEIFLPSNKIHREVGRAKDLSAPLYPQLWETCEEHKSAAGSKVLPSRCSWLELQCSHPYQEKGQLLPRTFWLQENCLVDQKLKDPQINSSNNRLQLISDFCRGVNEIFALLHCYAFEDVTDKLSRNVGNYHSTLRNNPEERRSPVLCSLQMKLRFNFFIHPITGHEGPKGEQRYSSTLPLTSELDGGGWSTPPYPRERPGTHCTEVWVGLRAGLDRCGKFRPHRDLIPGPSSP
jgi:hypothetical protein